jgi:hypothetical protein
VAAVVLNDDQRSFGGLNNGRHYEGQDPPPHRLTGVWP